MAFFYTFLWYLLLPVLFLRLFWRGRLAPAYRQRWHERVALGYRQPPLTQCVWVHAVSVGEFLAAQPLIEVLLKRHPEIPLLVTTTTPTGSAQVVERLGEKVQHVYCPWELPGALKRFIRHFNPRLAIILETELWPNLTRVADKAGCKLILANGRLSQKSHDGYARFPSLVKPMLQRFSALSVQTPTERDRFVSLGARPRQVSVSGSIKFDFSLPSHLKAQAELEARKLGDRPIWIAASTHPPEEESVLAAHQQILARQKDALLIWVPRHPERFGAVSDKLMSAGLTYERRSVQGAIAADTQVYLADTMGELLLLYGLADVAFVGGSLDRSLGGHNLLEPAAWGKPVVTGPWLANFMAIAGLLDAADALVCAHDADELGEKVLGLLQDTDTRQYRGNAAKEVVAANRGALKGLLALVESFWPAAK